MAEGKKRGRGAFGTFTLGIAVVTALYIANIYYPTLLAMAELKAFDLRLYTRPAKKPHGEVVIAAIDDKSISQIGRWPWPRAVLAQLVTALKKDQAAVIGFDLVFSEADDNDLQRARITSALATAGMPAALVDNALGPGNDAAFAQALKDQGEAFLGYPLELADATNHGKVSPGFVTKLRAPAPLAFSLVRVPPGPTPPAPAAIAYLPNLGPINAAAHGSAYFDAPTDPDAVFRAEMMVIRFGARYCEPLVVALTSAYANNAMTTLTMADFGVARMTIGPVELPVDERGRMLVNFRGPSHTFPYYAVSDIIAGRVPAQLLAGRIVLVGATALGIGDRWSTPMGADFPGVEIHANAIDNILTGDFLQRTAVTSGIERMAALAVGVAVSAAVAWLPAIWSAAAALALCAGYFAFAQHQLTANGLLLGILFPLATGAMTYGALASYRYLTEGREKRYLRRAFELYLHPSVIESLVNDRNALKLGGERRHLSILFADIVGFTTRAEKTPPEELATLLNTYMTAMIDVIMQSGGVVDKLMGDGIMAFWGAPVPMANPALAAVNCALEMLAQLRHLAQTDPRFATVDIGVGIATGEAIVGNFGGQQRFDYSVVGDTVNLASRLEGLTRVFKVHLLVNQQTWEEAKCDHIARPLGAVRVKGKTQQVPVVEIAGRAADRADSAFYQQFAAALRLAETGPPPQAFKAFEDLAHLKPGDHMVELYLERLRGAPEPNGRPRFGFTRLFRRPPEKVDLPAVIQPTLFEFDTK